MPSLPPLNSLRAFEATARHLSMKEAAGELAVTPGAISQLVRGLEERLGTRLDATVVLEEMENPFLADFYADRPGAALAPARYANRRVLP